MQADELVSWATLLPKFREVLLKLRSLGLHVSDTSRWKKYEGYFEEALRDPEAPLAEWLVLSLAFAVREADEMIEILTHVPDPADSATLKLLREVVKGTPMPDDEKSAPGRENQYELYLGTVLRQAGISACHGNPDLAATFDGHTYFIEAKRPSSLSRVDDRVRSAMKQIRRLGKPGIIAVCLDQVIRPPRGLLFVRHFSDLAPAVAQLVDEFVIKTARIWRSRVDPELIGGVLMTARVPAQIIASGHLAIGTNHRIELFGDEPREPSKFLAAVVAAYLRAQKSGGAA